MKLGDLKPKGSNMTFREWAEICNASRCYSCEVLEECRIIFHDEVPYRLPIKTEVELCGGTE